MSPPPSDASDRHGEEPLDVIQTRYFEGANYPNRVELTITREELSDEDNVQEFGDAMLSACKHRQATNALIDVSKLRFVTSSVLSRFITLHRELSRDGGQVILADPGEMFRDVLEATHLDDYFHVSASLEDGRNTLVTGGGLT